MIKNQPKQRYVFHYINVYGRRVQLRIKSKKINHNIVFYYGTIGFNQKWIAVDSNKITLINKIFDRLSVVFEQCSLLNNFDKWKKMVT